MPEFRCQQCHATCEAEETPSTCPICGAVGEEFLAPAGRDSVESLFDLEPLKQRPTKSGGEPARLKDRAGSQSAPGEPGNEPLSSTPTLVEASGGLQAATTVELEEGELEPEAPGEAPLKAASTLELDDSDLAPPAPPPVPAAPSPSAPAVPAAPVSTTPIAPVPSSTGVTRLDLLGGRLSSGLSSLSMLRGGAAAYEGSEGRETVDLDESDLEQVEPAAKPPASPAPAPPPAAPALPSSAAPAGSGGAARPAVASPRALRGRVAFPIRADQTPPPTTLPKEVNELAVAGEPPMPARRTDRPLTGQTESLSSIQARKRRRAMATLGLPVLAAAALGAVVIFARTRDPEAPVVAVAGADQGAPSPAPDLRPPSPDLTSPDLGRPDLPRPDLAARRRPVAPVLAAKKPAVRARPDAGPAPSASSKAEAQAAYQEGLRKLLQGQTEEAVRLFNQALTKQPRFSLAYRGIGLAYQRLGRKPMARAAFERYLLLQPKADDADAIRARLESLKD